MKPSDITGEKIRKLRNSLGMSQEDFGKELGVSERVIRYRENGGRDVNRLIAYAIIGLQLVYKNNNKRG